MTIADARSLAVLAGIAALVAGLLVAIEPSAVLSIAALPAILIVVWLAWGAMRNSRTALLLLLFVAVFLIDAVFRVREYENKDLDFQVILKLGVWLTIASVAFFHARDWLDRMFTPTNFPVVLFLLWLFASTINSPVPMPLYGTVAAFSIFAYVAFAAYLFSQLDEMEVFAVLTITLVIFCLVSIAVYFAMPELGRFTYWEGEVRYQSNRMSGIAGSANNMGRIAALALIVIGLYAREFHRLHRFFVPIAALVSGVALVMTNSRTSIATVAVILFAVYFMKWRRLYIGVFLLSAGLVALALVLPAGDQILALVSRSGSIDEITSLTGRTEIWYAVAKLSEAYPLSGYGYASSIFILPQHAHEIGDLTSQAHNLMLQLLLTTGWIGVVLFIVAVIGVAFRAIATADRTVLALLSFVLLNGITEASGFATVANICSLAFALAVTLPPPRTIDADDYSYQRGFS